MLEEIRLVLEFNHASLNQNALLAVVFLGHLYNYSVCDSPIIFRVNSFLFCCFLLSFLLALRPWAAFKPIA